MRVEEAEEDVLAYMAVPEQHWRQPHSTNPLERQNREIHRRKGVVGIFPNAASLTRLVTMLPVEQNEDWSRSSRPCPRRARRRSSESGKDDAVLAEELLLVVLELAAAGREAHLIGGEKVHPER